MSETKLIDIKELKFDEHNFNRHNDEGMSLLEKSIKENGLGRSILLDKANNIVGGNRRAAKELAQTLEVVINPLGDWTGGTGVDSGATNRKLGSDMGDGVTGGGLHGKDLSKADVSVNIYCHQLAQAAGKPVTAFCAIGDEEVIVRMAGEEARLVPYVYIVEQAKKYINSLGGFERFAEWGLIR